MQPSHPPVHAGPPRLPHVLCLLDMKTTASHSELKFNKKYATTGYTYNISC